MSIDTPKKWIHEEVLQRYIKENPHKWRINGKKVISIHYNEPFDRYPDLWFTVEGEKERIPVEVEWSSTDFDHPIDILQNKNGWVFVCYKNLEDEQIGIPQYQIKHDGFVKWFNTNAKKLLMETIANYKKPVKRKTPKLWIEYISTRVNSLEQHNISNLYQTSGIPEKSPAFKKFKEIQKNDLIMFVIQGIGFSGRVPKKKWHQKSFKGKFKQIQVFRITSDYYKSDKIIWKPSKSGEIWPHRYNFDELDSKGTRPLLDLKNVLVNKMSIPAKEQLRIAVSANFIEGDYSTLVECMHNGEQAT